MKVHVNSFIKQYFGKFTVGVHIRTNFGSADKVVPMISPTPSLFMQAAEQLSHFQGVCSYEDVKWFLSVGNPEILAELITRYPGKIISFDNMPIDVPNHFDRVTYMGIISFWILGEADEIIATELSSFGLGAASRTGKIPISCNAAKRRGTETQWQFGNSGFCVRKLSPHSCMLSLGPPRIENCLKDSKFKFRGIDTSCAYFYGPADEVVLDDFWV